MLLSTALLALHFAGAAVALLPDWWPRKKMPLDMGFTDEDASFNGYEDIRKEGDQGKSKCRDYIMVYVRGTAQPGNLGRSRGGGLDLVQHIHTGLEGKVLIQGLNYAAAWPSNVLDDRAFQDYGCRKSDAELYKNLIHDMLEFCDKSSLILAGYSQGAALTHRTIPLVDLQDRKRIRGIYLYGDTQKQKTRGGRVSEYPMERCLNICDAGDSFCERGISGAFLHVENPVTHEMYNKWSKPAAAWLVQQAKAGDWMMEDMLTDRRPRFYPPNQAGLDAIHGPWDSDDNPLGSRKAR